MRDGERREAAVSAANALELPPAGVGVEIIAADEFEPAGRRELLRAGSAQEHVFRVLHHRARELDGVSDAGQAAHRACLEGCAVHDRGVELVAPVERENRAVPRVEQPVVLERNHRFRHRVEARTPAVEYLKAGRERRVETGAIFRFALRTHLRARQGTGAAVNR